VDRQAQLPDFLADRPTVFPQLGAILSEKEEIVHVADVAAHLEIVLHEMVERIKVNVGKKLACQVADRQAPCPLAHREEIAAGFPDLL